MHPLSIPVMGCRAQQALYLLALEPVAEMLSDKNAYGFRPRRGTADDFIITCASKEVLIEKVMPTVSKFLADRGLVLSEEKTKITHIEDGFDFLSINIRKYRGKYLSKPSRDSVKPVYSIEKLRLILIKLHCSSNDELI